jgi:hypothetical protein
MEPVSRESPADQPSDTPAAEQAGHAIAPSARMSAAALSGFALVVLAVLVGCGSLIGSIFAGWNSWVGVLVAPVLALNGCILSFLALKNIERADGGLMGRPVALVALFCGVGVTAIQGALVLFALATLSASTTLAPVASEFVNHALADREQLARGLLSEDQAEQITPERLDAFAQTVGQRLGDSSTGSAGFRLIVDARRAFRDAGSMEGYQPEAGRQPRPVFLNFGDRRVLAYVFVNAEALTDKTIRIDDMLVIAGEGEVIVLAPDGPARELAEAAGWSIITTDTEESDQDLMLE